MGLFGPNIKKIVEKLLYLELWNPGDTYHYTILLKNPRNVKDLSEDDRKLAFAKFPFDTNDLKIGSAKIIVGKLSECIDKYNYPNEYRDLILEGISEKKKVIVIYDFFPLRTIAGDYYNIPKRYKGLGVGSATYDAIMDDLKKVKSKWIFLINVTKGATKFFESKGFKYICGEANTKSVIFYKKR